MRDKDCILRFGVHCVGVSIAMGRSGRNASDSRPMGQRTTVGLDFELVPFAEGASREAFRATVQEGGCYKGYTNGTRLVLKTFKPDYYNKGLRVSEHDVTMQAYVKQLADEFNDEVCLTREGQPCNIYVRVAKLDEFRRDFKHRKRTVFVQGEQFLLEQEIKGTFQKFNSNSGWSAGDNVADAFSHWSWVKTHSLVVCDLQGVRGGPGQPMHGGGRERFYYLLTDPAINSMEKKFGVSDMGKPGIQTFFYKHVCNDLCLQLGLAGDRPQGIQRLPVVQHSSYGSLSSASDSDSRLVPQQAHIPSLAAFKEDSDEDEEPDTTQISPTEIFFTHNSISQRFSCGRYIENTYEQLRRRQLNISVIPLMKVTKQNGKYWTYTGNRRLWVFRKLHSAGMLDRIEVQIVQRAIPTKRFTTRNGGVSVEIRGRPDATEIFSPAPRASEAGVWILASSAADDDDEGGHWLWHATLRREVKMYDYPENSRMVLDGIGGVWVLCSTSGEKSWQLGLAGTVATVSNTDLM